MQRYEHSMSIASVADRRHKEPIFSQGCHIPMNSALVLPRLHGKSTTHVHQLVGHIGDEVVGSRY